MGQQVRAYLDLKGDGLSSGEFFGKPPIKNTEPGWPGTHYVDFALEQFREEIPVIKKGILKRIEEDSRFAAASIEVGPIQEIESKKDLKKGYKACGKKVGITYNISSEGVFCTIWAPSITLLIEALESLV